MVHFLCVPAANYELERKEGGREGERKAAIFFFFFQGEPLRGGGIKMGRFSEEMERERGDDVLLLPG